MKSLTSIIEKLSPDEIQSFRFFLSSHSRSGRNKKLELFDSLLDRCSDATTINQNITSRQSAYQLKKRLQEELYSFLIMQDQTGNCSDQFFVEMDCHKKLYCFKILYDKGIRDHARHVLDEIIDISARHSLHTIYLEAVNLRNAYFPLANNFKKKIPIRNQLGKLKESLGRNLYINQYLTEYASDLHENDGCFRLTLINELVCFDLSETEPVIGELMEVNHLICQRDFKGAREKLLALLRNATGWPAGEPIAGLILVELTKVYICTGDLEESRSRLAGAVEILGRVESFVHVILELQFVISFRENDFQSMAEIISRAKREKKIRESDVLNVKWSWYSLLLTFRQGNFREVIRSINSDPVFMIRTRSWMVNVRMIELICILRLKDFDWLYYKIESLRKIVNADVKLHRYLDLLATIRALAGEDKTITAQIDEVMSSSAIDQTPWHPLSVELINLQDYVKDLRSEHSRNIRQHVAGALMA